MICGALMNADRFYILFLGSFKAGRTHPALAQLMAKFPSMQLMTWYDMSPTHVVSHIFSAYVYSRVKLRQMIEDSSGLSTLAGVVITFRKLRVL